MIRRRSLITGLVSLIAAPAIVRAGSLMPVRGVILEPEFDGLPVLAFRGINDQFYGPSLKEAIDALSKVAADYPPEYQVVSLSFKEMFDAALRETGAVTA